LFCRLGERAPEAELVARPASVADAAAEVPAAGVAPAAPHAVVNKLDFDSPLTR